jgi:hypothetical protein
VKPSTSTPRCWASMRAELVEAWDVGFTNTDRAAAVLRRSEGTGFSSPNDDAVGGLPGAIRAERAWRAEQSKWSG